MGVRVASTHWPELLIPAALEAEDMVEDRGIADKIKGKTNQIAGDIKGDKAQSLKGHAQELKGDVKRSLTRERDRV